MTNILEAGVAILVAAGAAIATVLAKLAIQEIRHPQREIQLPLPEAKPKDKDRELEHVG